jgi:cytochrome c-type biogenesis protein CcmE
MKSKFIFGGIIISVFMVVMIVLLTQSSIQYEENFQKIKASDRSFKATGAWVKEKNHLYDKQNRTFSFYMADAHGTELKVVYNGTMPNNFESAQSVVVTGHYRDGVFEARDILTKCPSKYEGQYDVEKKKNASL